MEIELIDIPRKVPRQGAEVVDALALIVHDAFILKKGVQAVTDNLKEIMQAVEGIKEVSEAIGSEYADELFGYFVEQMAEALKKK